MNDQPKLSAPAPIAQAVIESDSVLRTLYITCSVQDCAEWVKRNANRWGMYFDMTDVTGTHDLHVAANFDMQEVARYIAQEIGAVIQ